MDALDTPHACLQVCDQFTRTPLSEPREWMWTGSQRLTSKMQEESADFPHDLLTTITPSYPRAPNLFLQVL